MYAVLYLPNFPLQALQRREPVAAEQPLALVDTELREPLVVQCNEEAARAGVAAGLTPSQALARCGSLLLKPRQAAQEKHAAEILLQTAYAFSANIEATAPGVCTLELKGLPLPDEAARQAWGGRLLKALAVFQLEARLGIAPTPDLALMAAHAARPVLMVQEPGAFTAALSLAVLNPPPEIFDVLHLWGIETVGAFIALGKDKVAERLGEDALELFDRVSPQAVRPLRLVLPAEHFTEQLEFEKEIETLEPLLLVLRRFLEHLTGRLAVLHLVVGEMELGLGLASGEKNILTFKVPAPTNEIEVLFRTLRTHLEALHAASPVANVSLTIRPARLQGHQFGLFEITLRNPNRFSETVARLAALCGGGRVGSPVLEPTHQPDSFHLRSPQFDDTGPSSPAGRPAGPVLRRFRPLLPATLVFCEERPVAMRSAVFTGPLLQAAGPFVSSGHWWESPAWQREEWDARTGQGMLYRIFRSGTGDFVEGVYD